MRLIGYEDLETNWLNELGENFPHMNIPAGEQLKFKKLLSGLSLERGEHLINEGDIPRRIAFVVSGIFRAYYLTESGVEKTIVFREKGRALSAYSSYLTGDSAKFSIQALEKSLVLFITIKDFEMLRSGDSSWERIRGEYFTNLFIEKESRERELMSDDAETRYNQFLRDYPGLIDRINHYHIASYLGISNVTLSRIRHGKG